MMQEVWEVLRECEARKASEARFSVRQYDGAPVEAEAFARLERIAAQLSCEGARISLQPEGAQTMIKGFLGGAGPVKGACAYAAFFAKEGVNAALAGYVGEAFVLACTSLGLGTVWLGGTLDKKAVRSKLAESGERLWCITPVGKAAAGVTMPPRKRMTLEKLTGMKQEALAALEPWQLDALECARSAPSAVNAQPWRFSVEGEDIAIRNHGVNYGFGLLDTGIARLHRDAALLAAGRPALGYDR